MSERACEQRLPCYQSPAACQSLRRCSRVMESASSPPALACETSNSLIHLHAFSDQAVLHPCLHAFDYEILIRWMETFDTCPNCRQPVARIERLCSLEVVGERTLHDSVSSSSTSATRMRDLDRRSASRAGEEPDRMPLFDGRTMTMGSTLTSGTETLPRVSSRRQRVTKSLGRAMRRIRRFFRSIASAASCRS